MMLKIFPIIFLFCTCNTTQKQEAYLNLQPNYPNIEERLDTRFLSLKEVIKKFGYQEAMTLMNGHNDETRLDQRFVTMQDIVGKGGRVLTCIENGKYVTSGYTPSILGADVSENEFVKNAIKKLGESPEERVTLSFKDEKYRLWGRKALLPEKTPYKKFKRFFCYIPFKG